MPVERTPHLENVVLFSFPGDQFRVEFFKATRGPTILTGLQSHAFCFEYRMLRSQSLYKNVLYRYCYKVLFTMFLFLFNKHFERTFEIFQFTVITQKVASRVYCFLGYF